MDPISIVGGALAGEAFKRTPIGERMMGILDYIGLAPQEKPAPVEERNPPVMTQARPDTANRNPMIPIDQAPVSPDPMNQGINQDMAGFAQSQSDLPMVQQKVGQRAQQLMQEVPEEKRNTKEAQDGAFALSVAENAQVAANAKDQEGIQNTLKKAFGNEEMWLTLALGFNSMRMRPDAGLAGVIGNRLESIRSSKKANQTIAALRAKGTPEAIQAAEYIAQTGDAKGGMKMLMQSDQYVTGSGKEIEEQFGIKGLIPNKPYRYNKLTKKVEGVGGGDTIFEATKPSKGMQFVRDESGKILYEEPIPRKLSPEAATTKARSSVLVMDEMDRLLNLVEESPSMTTGFGTFLSKIPTTDARNAQRLADTIKGNIGFDRLQRMREESPTGGALGQVAVQELMALQSTMGSLDLGQDAETVKYNVNRLKQQYAKTMLALADAQPNFEEYFPDFNRAAYEEIASRPTGQGEQKSTKPQITPEQAAKELARRREERGQ